MFLYPASILVKGVNKSDDFLVTLYDDEARRYFEMPDNIWIGLAALSFKSEFIYSVKKQEVCNSALLNDTDY